METKKSESKPVVTRAEKRDAVKNLIREILAKGSVKSNDLIDEAARLYAERFGGEDTENPNDVKGRVGSVLDVMKKDGDVQFDGGVYEITAPSQEEKPLPKKRKTAKRESPISEEEKLVKAKRTASKKKEEKKEENDKPLPPAPLQPIAPTAPTTPEIAPEPIPEDTVKNEEKPAPKKRGRKPRAETKTEEAKSETETEEIKEATEQENTEAKKEEKAEPKAEEKKEEKKAEISPKGMLMDMSFLFGNIKPVEKPQPKPIEKAEKAEKPVEIKQETKQEVKQEKKAEVKKVEQKKTEIKKSTQKTVSRGAKKPLTPDEKLQEAFLNRLHRLGGEYFEYYSVYLLEKYSRRNGRRLESLKITGGDHDGGIDGEIELTDKLGFRETIYIQSKNWDPDKGSEKLWVVGETLLQQFIGACVCRQAKDGKQHCRGIFITTSRFTPEAKRMLDDTADKFVGYDGAELYETAKECAFGIVKKNGEWVLDEELLSGTKAFFNMI
ncbi:MAG: restriction endonuclease [Clostridia bacterium]|nr:restriction endonuclease [Clostridia bacterium]